MLGGFPEIMAEWAENTSRVFEGKSFKLAFVTNWLKSKGLQKLCTNWLLTLSRVTQANKKTCCIKHQNGL